MNDPMLHLRAVIEGEPDIEPWKPWFERNASFLADYLNRTDYLDLKLNRIRAIPRILERFGIPFSRSSRYDYLGGMPGRCRDCGAELENAKKFDQSGGGFWCPNGCFRGHVLRRP